VARSIIMDEYHVTVRAPSGLPEAEYAAIRRALNDAQFQTDLRRAVRDVFRRHLALSKIRLTVTS
jgi:hypothetical protein